MSRDDVKEVIEEESKGTPYIDPEFSRLMKEARAVHTEGTLNKYDGIDLSNHVHSSIYHEDEVGYLKTTNLINNNEEISMNTRRVVSINLIDDDKGLPVEYSLVISIEDIITEDDNETTIREILMNPELNIQKKLEHHNEVRSEVVDEEILKRTGNKVHLRPVKLKDLRWEVK